MRLTSCDESMGVYHICKKKITYIYKRFSQEWTSLIGVLTISVSVSINQGVLVVITVSDHIFSFSDIKDIWQLLQLGNGEERKLEGQGGRFSISLKTSAIGSEWLIMWLFICKIWIWLLGWLLPTGEVLITRLGKNITDKQWKIYAMPRLYMYMVWIQM